MEEESCGDGIDCCNVCASYGGQSSNCVTFLNGEGDDPRAQAEEHCQQAQINPNYNCPNEGLYYVNQNKTKLEMIS